jgi:uncharacterized membrane protein YeaQ/YmgE (transglycosylase-associated protein family)
MILGILGWIVVAVVVGFIASKFVNLRGDDPRFGIAAAIGGGIVVALVYRMISGVAVTAWNPRSLLFAGIGAVVGVVIWHAVRSRYISKERYVPRSSY